MFAGYAAAGIPGALVALLGSIPPVVRPGVGSDNQFTAARFDGSLEPGLEVFSDGLNNTER